MSFRTMAVAFALVLALGSVAVALAGGDTTEPASASPAKQHKVEANSKDKLSAEDFRKVGAGENSDQSGDDLFDDSVGTKDDDDWDDDDEGDDDWDDDDTNKDSKDSGWGSGSGDSGHSGGDTGGSTG